MTTLYGMAGLGAGAGKDTVAAEMMQQDESMVRIGFADKIKEIAADVLGISVAEVNRIKDDESHPKCAKMRSLLQVIGTEAFRSYDPDVWVNYALRIANEYRANGHTVVITDVRFPNEFDRVEAEGGKLVDVHCLPEQLRVGPGHPRYNHESERALDEYRAAGKFRQPPHITVMNDRKTPIDIIADEILNH